MKQSDEKQESDEKGQFAEGISESLSISLPLTSNTNGPSIVINPLGQASQPIFIGNDREIDDKNVVVVANLEEQKEEVDEVGVLPPVVCYTKECVECAKQKAKLAHLVGGSSIGNSPAVDAKRRLGN